MVVEKVTFPRGSYPWYGVALRIARLKREMPWSNISFSHAAARGRITLRISAEPKFVLPIRGVHA